MQECCNTQLNHRMSLFLLQNVHTLRLQTLASLGGDFYLEGFAGQGGGGLHHAIGDAQQVGVVEEGRHQGDVAGTAPRLKQTQRPALRVPANVIQDQIKPVGARGARKWINGSAGISAQDARWLPGQPKKEGIKSQSD